MTDQRVDSPQARLRGARRRRSRRMTAKDREDSILRGATAYFAENGLNAGTIELARRLGIAQALLYRYFPTKEALIERVFEGMAQHWKPGWEALLEDTGIPARERLKLFYVDYAASVLSYEHVRLFLFSGLTKNSYNARYYELIADRILRRVAMALRLEYGSGRRGPVTPEELELAQSLHAAVYHVAFRRWVHGEPLPDDLTGLISRKVDVFLDGATFSMHRPQSAGATRHEEPAAPRTA